MFSSPSSYRENQSVDCFSTWDPQDRIVSSLGPGPHLAQSPADAGSPNVVLD